MMFDQFSQSNFSQNQFSDQLTTPGNAGIHKHLQKMTGAELMIHSTGSRKQDLVYSNLTTQNDIQSPEKDLNASAYRRHFNAVRGGR